MSLNKAIASGKEHRVEYGTKGQPYAKSVDTTCRNHGSCYWCYKNRRFKQDAMNKLTKNEIQDYLNLWKYFIWLFQNLCYNKYIKWNKEFAKPAKWMGNA